MLWWFWRLGNLRALQVSPCLGVPAVFFAFLIVLLVVARLSILAISKLFDSGVSNVFDDSNEFDVFRAFRFRGFECVFLFSFAFPFRVFLRASSVWTCSVTFCWFLRLRDSGDAGDSLVFRDSGDSSVSANCCVYGVLAILAFLSSLVILTIPVLAVGLFADSTHQLCRLRRF